MPTLLQRNREDFKFVAPPLQRGQNLEEFNRKQLENLHNFFQSQLDSSFRQIAEKLYELEERVEVLEP